MKYNLFYLHPIILFIVSLSSALGLVFFFLELLLLVGRRSKRSSVKNRKDKGSLLLLWTTIPVCLTIGFTIAGNDSIPHFNHLVKRIGDVVVISGFIFRWTAIFQLGRSFTVDVAIMEGHQLKTNGLYRLVRHPSYTGLLLIIIGIALTMDNWLSLFIVIIPVFIAILYRVSVEEKILMKEFGEAYEEYQKKVKKIVPGLY